jgi:hypothetical protein
MSKSSDAVPTADQLIQRLEHKFSIEGYLQLRRRFPGEDTALWMVLAADSTSIDWGMDFAFQLEADFKKFNISMGYFLGTLGGVNGDVDRLCLATLEALSARKVASHQG